jgi:signal transduction histidine kinase
MLFVSASQADRLVLTLLFAQEEVGGNLELCSAVDGKGFYDALFRQSPFRIVVIDQRQLWSDWRTLVETCSLQYPDAMLVLLSDSVEPPPFDESVAASYPRTSAGLLALSRLVTKLMTRELAAPRSEDAADRDSEDAEGGGDDGEALVYAVSHDLQDPLQLATRYADLLSEECARDLGESGGKVLDHLRFNLTRTQDMLDELLAYSRLQRTLPEREPVDFNDLLDEAIEQHRLTLDELGAEVDKQQELPTLSVDRRQFQRVFQNLIGNAIKFRSERPLKISVRAQRVRDEWRIAIKDNGIGIADEHVGRIFGMFERGGAPDDVPGTGMGLAICRRILRRHGGDIRVSTALGSGSVFIFTLPQHEPA